MIPTRIGVLNAAGTGVFAIDYTLTGDAATKEMTIDVNAVEVVNCTSNCSGRIYVDSGKTVQVAATAIDSVNISMTLTVVDGVSTLYNNTQTGDLSFTDSFGPYTPVANGSITVLAGTI
jgi:hypothetical protein